jgi:hypothetical protein
MCSLRLYFIYFNTFNGLSNIILLQKQDLGMQTLHSAHQLRQQRNISSLRWTTVKNVCPNYSTINRTRLKTEPNYSTYSVAKYKTKLQHVTWITTKQRTTLQHIRRIEVKHSTKLHNIKQKMRLTCTAFISNIIRFNEMLANMQCTTGSFATPYRPLHMQ